MRKTKIVATIGPASAGREVLAALFEAGVDVARLNLSHGEPDLHVARCEQIRETTRRLGRQAAVMFDLKGPEIRIGTFPGGQVELREGGFFTFTTRPGVGSVEAVSVGHPGLTRDVKPGFTLLLDDGNLVLEAVEVTEAEVRCRVIAGGVLADRKKINLPGHTVSLPAVSDKDARDIRLAASLGVDFIAVSFTRRAADVLDVRRILEEHGSRARLIAKIESAEGLQNLEEILKVADGLMVARGDLGVEVPTEDIPLHQKRMIARCNAAGKPVITATQMLESMVRLPRPTRAEASDVANAILDGTDAVMLSAETAAGKYPVEAVRMMARIAERTEASLDYRGLLLKGGAAPQRTVTDAISHATVTTAMDLGASAILTSTHSGHTARMVAKYRPAAPVVAITPDESVARWLAAVWGVFPVVERETASTDEMIDLAVQSALRSGLVKSGDLVVITAGVPAGVPGTTNLLKVHTVGDVLVRGTGIGGRSVSGRAVVARTVREAEAGFEAGGILVTTATDREFVPLMEKAVAIVTEEAGLTSHAAVVGLSLGIPVVVGAEGATGKVANGSVITVDAARGLIYRGHARAL